MSKLYDLLSAMCGKIKKPDWNQNDSTAANYVKNRPFYTGDPVETVLVEESTMSFREDNGLYITRFPATFEATVGDTYKVSWDGTTYECTCAYVMGIVAIGNPSIPGVGDDTGEPFIIAAGTAGEFTIYTADVSASHTISISADVGSVVQIDRKYLPLASETEPGIISANTLSDSVMSQVENEYFAVRTTQVYGYGDAATIEEYAGKNNSYSISSPGKFGGAVLSCYNDYANKYITSVVSGGAKIECWKFSEGSTAMEQLWGISEDGVVISSSTPDSTKKFRITVDDSGTISATEVT